MTTGFGTWHIFSNVPVVLCPTLKQNLIRQRYSKLTRKSTRESHLFGIKYFLGTIVAFACSCMQYVSYIHLFKLCIYAVSLDFMVIKKKTFESLNSIAYFALNRKENSISSLCFVEQLNLTNTHTCSLMPSKLTSQLEQYHFRTLLLLLFIFYESS